ncbi:YpmS family protein [Virgibacillus kekensis]|uniref:YpmS family protein n=1 Tax=Virgibacillus kekensis TaxID=202261 RepID=A0ABV9DJN9_9BACI
MAESRKRRNKWKRLFLGLLIVNIVVFAAIIALIFWPVSGTDRPPAVEEDTQPSSEFIVRTTKNNLNELVNAYIDKLLRGTNHHYSVLLEEDVHLIGELPVFSSTVPLSVHFEPFVQKNGDVVLKQKSISIGLLQLPNQKIMEYMKKYLPMPEWVSINPKEEEIYLAVTDMEIRSNFEVSVEHIDLEANNLAFKFRIPYETLGIETRQQEVGN